MQSVGERRGQQCVSPSSPPFAQLLSTSLFISPSLLHLSVFPSHLLRCWYMTDPGEDVEVPCGQESQVSGVRKEEVTQGRMRRRRGGGEEVRLMGEWMARSLEVRDDCNAVQVGNTGKP